MDALTVIRSTYSQLRVRMDDDAGQISSILPCCCEGADDHKRRNRDEKEKTPSTNQYTGFIRCSLVMPGEEDWG